MNSKQQQTPRTNFFLHLQSLNYPRRKRIVQSNIKTLQTTYVKTNQSYIKGTQYISEQKKDLVFQPLLYSNQQTQQNIQNTKKHIQSLQYYLSNVSLNNLSNNHDKNQFYKNLSIKNKISKFKNPRQYIQIDGERYFEVIKHYQTNQSLENNNSNNMFKDELFDLIQQRKIQETETQNTPNIPHQSKLIYIDQIEEEEIKCKKLQLMVQQAEQAKDSPFSSQYFKQAYWKSNGVEDLSKVYNQFFFLDTQKNSKFIKNRLSQILKKPIEMESFQNRNQINSMKQVNDMKLRKLITSRNEGIKKELNRTIQDKKLDKSLMKQMNEN